MELLTTQDILELFLTEEIEMKIKEKYQNADIEKLKREFIKLKPFKVNENIYETGQTISEETHYMMRLLLTEVLKVAFQIMKIDLTDPNVSDEDSIGTPGRIAKMWLGKNPDDTNELLSARFNRPPKITSFPNEEKIHQPVFVKTSLDAVCSHHFIRFGDNDKNKESYVIIGYIPRKKLGGISKINRFVDWCSRRGWLQEDLTRYIGRKIEEYFETDSVYVKLSNIQHGCSVYRGACDRNASTSTVYMSGEFLTNPNIIPSEYR